MLYPDRIKTILIAIMLCFTSLSIKASVLPNSEFIFQDVIYEESDFLISRTNLSTGEKLSSIRIAGGMIVGEEVKGLTVDSDGIYVVYDVSKMEGEEEGTFIVTQYTHEGGLIRPALFETKGGGSDITAITAQADTVQIELTERATGLVTVQTVGKGEFVEPEPEYSIEFAGIRYDVYHATIYRTNLSTGEELRPINGFMTGEVIKGLDVDSDGIYVVYDVSTSGHEEGEEGTYAVYQYTHEGGLIRPALFETGSGVDITAITAQTDSVQVEVTERATGLVTVQTVGKGEFVEPEPEYSIEFAGIRYDVYHATIYRTNLSTGEELRPINGFMTGEVIKGLDVDSDGIYVVYDVSTSGHEEGEEGTYAVYQYTHEGGLIRPALFETGSGVDITAITAQTDSVQVEVTERATGRVTVQTVGKLYQNPKSKPMSKEGGAFDPFLLFCLSGVALIVRISRRYA